MDTKTGDRVKALSFTAQLALYAQAAVAIVWPADRDDECIVRELPAIDDEVAVVAHVPAGQGRCELWSVDLATGREALETAHRVRRLRALDKPHKLLTPIATTVAILPTPSPTDPFDGISGEAPAGPAPAELRAWLVERIRTLIADHGAAARALALRWPPSIPKLSERDDHTEAQLDIVIGLVDAVEDEHNVTFFTPDPRRRPSEPRTVAPEPRPTAWQPPEEGDRIDDAAYEALATKLKASAHLPRLDAWGAQAHAAGRPFSALMLRSVRRFEILLAALSCAEYFEDEDIVRCALGLVLGEELQPAMTTGMAFGSLSIDEARRLTAIAEAFVAGDVQLHYDAEGNTHLDLPAALTAA